MAFHQREDRMSQSCRELRERGVWGRGGDRLPAKPASQLQDRPSRRPGEGVQERGRPAGPAGRRQLSVQTPAALLSVIAPPPALRASSGSAPAAGLKSDPGGRRALPVDSEPGHSLGPRPPPQPGPLSWRHQGPGARGPGNPRKGLARPTGHSQSRSRKACRKGYFGPQEAEARGTDPARNGSFRTSWAPVHCQDLWKSCPCLIICPSSRPHKLMVQEQKER